MKRTTVRIAAYAAAAITVITVSGLTAAAERKKYCEALESIRLPALSALCEYAEDISSGLKIMSVSSDESLEDVRAFVKERASAASAGLYCFDAEKTQGISRLFSSAYALADSYTPPDSAKAAELSEISEKAFYKLDRLVSGVLYREYSLLETQDNFFENELDMDFDGDFALSSGTENASPAAAGAGIGREEAAKRAGEILDTDPVLWREDESTENDAAGTYGFYHGDTRIKICRADGRVYSFQHPLPCRTRQYEPEEAELIARNFLESQGITRVVLCDSYASEFTASFVFAPVNGDAALLMSKVIIDVCLASGKLTAYDASEYIRNYSPDMTAQDVSPDLESLLPAGAEERGRLLCFCEIKNRVRLCYRVRCLFRGEYYYLFYDYYTLKNVMTRDAG